MKNPKIGDAANGECQLPEPIIHRIQYFLSGKQAAQTSILSKSWHRAWLTRPNLDFNQRDYYRSYGDQQRFLEFAKKTMQRYEQSNLNIFSFRLSMELQVDSRVLCGELIAKALKLGATELFLSECLNMFYSRCPINNTCEFRNLKILWLEWLDIYPVFSHDSSFVFSCLKILTLRNCFSRKGIRISSPSLERISFVDNRVLRATLDVPNIRKFAFSSYKVLPHLAFERASRDWVSDLSIECGGSDFKTSWFLELERFLQELSLSKVYFSLEIGSSYEIVSDYGRDVQGLPKPVVENLTMKLDPGYITGNYDLLKCLFRSCKPNFITQYCEDLQQRGWSWNADDNFLELICKTLMLKVSENRNISRLPGLEEVHVECFEETLAKWLPLSLKTLLDASTCLEDNKMIRFRLRWR